MAYLEITLTIDDKNRAEAAAVYHKYKAPFLESIKGARSKDLLIRDEDVQVLHGFDSAEDAANYLSTEMFTKDIVEALSPLLSKEPEVRIYTKA